MPDSLPRPSTRSIIAGFVLAVLLCGINSYLTLSFGVIEEGPTIAALFFFAFFFMSRTKITSAEMVIVATMGSAGGSLGFISNFFAARAMVGAPFTFWECTGFALVTSLIGMVFVVPLRDLLILREDLPWPGSRATEGVIRALVEKGDPRQPWILLVTGVVAMTYVVLNDDGGFGVVPEGMELPMLAAVGGAISWSPFAIGGAYLMGFRACVGFLVGAIALMVMAPYVPTPTAPHRYVWPGIGFLVANGLMLLALNWKLVWASVRSLGAVRDSIDDDPIMGKKALLAFSGLVLAVTLGYSLFGLGLNLLVVVLLIVVGGGLQNIIATRAAAQTAFNPARVMGVLLEGVSAMAGASAAATNLVGAGFVAGSGAQAGNLTGDMAYGRWFRVPSRWQFWAQFLTIVPCSLVSAWVFSRIQAGNPLTIDGEGLPAPVAKMWAATALIFDGSSPMPPGAMMALAIGAAIGAVYTLLEEQPALGRWLPSSVGIGIGLVLPISYDLAFFLGGVVLWLILGKGFKVSTLTLTSIAVGCIVAEGLGGVLKPILAMLGVL